MSAEDDNSFLLEQATELEEILELMPGDIGTLNSLIYTFLQAEDTDKASEYALQLRTVLTASGDTDQLQSLASAYLELAPDNQIFQDLAQVNSDKTPASMPSIPAPSLESVTEEVSAPAVHVEEPAPAVQQFDLGAPDVSLDELCMQLNYELDLGELLKKEGLITENICDQAVESLIQHSSSPVAITLTLLSELINVQHVNMQKIYGVLSQKTNTPFINVSQFDIPEDVLEPFDMKVTKRLGVVPFAKFEKEIMIACLNPLDEVLKDTLESYLGTKLHFYLTSVEEIDKFYEKALS